MGLVISYWSGEPSLPSVTMEKALSNEPLLSVILGPINTQHVDPKYSQMIKSKYYSRKRKSPSKKLLEERK